MFETTLRDDNGATAKKPTKVQVPLLFSLRHTDNPHQTSYLLGTCHALPLSVLHDECMTVIKSCASFVTEESEDDALEYYTEATVRAKDSPDWFSDLSPEMAAFVEKAVDKCFENFHPLWRKKAQKLELWAAFQLAWHGFMNMIAERKSDTSHASDQGSLGMDCELILNMFEDSFGLEKLMDKIPRFKQEANSIQAFDELFEVSKTCLSTEEQSCELEAIITDYCNGGLFYNYQSAKEENDEPYTIARNINWIPNLLKHHAELQGPILFGVGELHLVGEQGLLALLPKHGFDIGRLQPDGSFQAYTYPFQSDYIVKMALSRERFMQRFIQERTVEAVEAISQRKRLVPMR